MNVNPSTGTILGIVVAIVLVGAFVTMAIVVGGPVIAAFIR